MAKAKQIERERRGQGKWMMMVSRYVVAIHKVDLTSLVLCVVYQEVQKRLWTGDMLYHLRKNISIDFKHDMFLKWLQHGIYCTSVATGCRAIRHWI